MLLILFIVFIYSNLSQVACVKSIIWQPVIYLILKKNDNKMQILLPGRIISRGLAFF
jgi:hypothetical protein